MNLVTMKGLVITIVLVFLPPHSVENSVNVLQIVLIVSSVALVKVHVIHKLVLASISLMNAIQISVNLVVLVIYLHLDTHLPRFLVVVKTFPSP
jgi:hypothetical protein